MFIKKLYKIFPLLDVLFLRWIIFLLSFLGFSQTTTESYENLWKVVENDTVTTEKKITYLDVYYDKARAENNLLEQYKALDKKTFLLPFNDASLLLHQMHPIVQKIDNDSVKGDFLNRSTVFYYDHRDFKNALYYAIASEAFNEEIHNLYNLNLVRITLGNIYNHTRYYDKAITYFTQAKNYYKTKKDYNHTRGYISSIYSLGKTYLLLKDTQKLNESIKEGEEAVIFLKDKDRYLESAYIIYLKGGLAFLQNKYHEAQNQFAAALPIITQNGDVKNEHVIYLYLGKIAWQQNQKTEAAVYFNKIDALFKNKHFLNYELREAYEYLIIYYKETGEVALQNKATESLMHLNQQFEKEQQSITRILNEDLDQKKLRKKEQLLQKQVNSSTFWMIGLGVVLVLLAVFLFWKQHKRKKLENKTLFVNEVFNETSKAKEYERGDGNVEVEEVVVSDIILPEPQQKYLETPKELTATEQRLFKGLAVFEKKKGYLAPITLEELAKKLHTTRSTLSPFLNEHKGSFSTYMNTLRMQQVIIDLTENKALREKTVKELAAIYGDLHPKTFSILFKAASGLSPSVFIEQLEQADS